MKRLAPGLVISLCALALAAAAQTPTSEELRAACVEAQRQALDETVAKRRYLSKAREAVLRRCASLADIATVTAPPAPAPSPTPPPAPPPPTSGDFARLAALAASAPVNAWRTIANTRIPLVPAATAQALGIHGNTGPRSVIDAWNSAAFTGRAFYVMGGGHADYGGNELYRFDLTTLAWTRVTEPSAYALTPGVYDYPLSGPESSHTYDGLAWSPRTQELIYVPGVLWTNPNAADPADSNWGRPRGIWAWSEARGTWRLVTRDFFKQDQPATAALSDGRIFIHVTGSSAILDPSTGTYGPALHERDFSEGNAVYAPDQRRVYITNGGATKRIDEANTTVTHVAGTPAFRHMNPCLAWHDGAKRFIAWDGTADIRLLNPATDAWTSLPMAGPGPSGGATAGVFGRCAWVPEAGVFVGYNDHAGDWWFFKPDLSREVALAAPAKTLAEQLAGLADGETRTIAPGVYAECAIVRASNVTLSGAGVHLKGRACEDKAAIVGKAAPLTLVGLEISDVRVGQNGAAVRWEGPGLLTLRGVNFHGSEMNVATNNDLRQSVVIESSRFGATNSDADLGHSIYIGRVGRFELRDSEVLGASNYGHLVKSRAAVNVIERNRLDQLDTLTSVVIDLPDGGNNVVRANTLRQGPRTDNAQIINIATEIHDLWTEQHWREGYFTDRAKIGTPIHREHAGSATLIEDNDVVSDWVGEIGPHVSAIALVSNGGTGPVTVRANRIIWPRPPAQHTRSYWRTVIWDASNLETVRQQ